MAEACLQLGSSPEGLSHRMPILLQGCKRISNGSLS